MCLLTKRKTGFLSASIHQWPVELKISQAVGASSGQTPVCSIAVLYLLRAGSWISSSKQNCFAQSTMNSFHVFLHSGIIFIVKLPYSCLLRPCWRPVFPPLLLLSVIRPAADGPHTLTACVHYCTKTCFTASSWRRKVSFWYFCEKILTPLTGAHLIHSTQVDDVIDLASFIFLSCCFSFCHHSCAAQ